MALDFEEPILELEKKISELQKLGENADAQFITETTELKRKLDEMLSATYSKLTPWQTVQVARHQGRPLLRDYIGAICSDFIELHGDRSIRDDPALIGGFATIDKQMVMLIGMDKGKTVEEKDAKKFGMANPEGYRKALRLMRLAEKYGLPVLCLVDTPAAYPGKEAEERGQAEAIARNITEMAALEVPIIAVITGEGGSGGALGISVADVVLMLTYSIYSVIPPEGCAAILWRDGTKAAEAAEALKITSASLLDLGIIDEIIPEPAGGAHRFPEETYKNVKNIVVKHLVRLSKYSGRRLVERRYEKYSKIGR